MNINNRIFKGMLLFLNNISIKRKLIYTYTVIIAAIVLIIGLSSYSIAVNYVENSEIRWLLKNLLQVNNSIDFNLALYMKKSDIVFKNTLLQEALSKSYDNIDEVTEAYRGIIDKIMKSIFEEVGYLNNENSLETSSPENLVIPVIFLNNESLPKDGGLIKDLHEIEKQDWYINFTSSKVTFYWELSPKENQKYIIFNRKLMNFNTMKSIGVLSVNISKNIVNDILLKNNKNLTGDMLYVNKADNSVICSTTQNLPDNMNIENLISLLNSNKKDYALFKTDSGKFVVTSVVSSITGARLVAVYRLSMVAESLKPIISITVAVLLMCLLISIIINILASTVITRRLWRIVTKIRHYNATGEESFEDIQGNDEIGELDRSFNQMVKRINELIQHEYKSKLIGKSMEIELLQAQINPHLLYNTLSMVKLKTKKQGMNDVFYTIEKLIRFYRSFLNNGQLITSISEEINMIKDYIEILKFTYNMEFHMEFDISDEVCNFYTIKLLLQPIVENAIVHGIRPMEDNGTIVLRGYIDKENIVFEVSDDGIGIETERLSQLNNGQNNGHRGYGLINVISRIKLYFGDEFGVSIESKNGFGTKVTVVIPAYSKQQIKKIFDYNSLDK